MSLVGRYYSAEKLTLLTGLILILGEAVGLDNMNRVPFLNVELRDPGKFILASTIVLLASVVFAVIEWKQSSEIARRNGLSRLRFGATLGVAFLALWLNLPTLTKKTSLVGIPRPWYGGYLALGLGIGMCLSILIFATLMIRTKDETIRLALPRVPVATRSQYIVWGPVLVALISVYVVANKYAPLAILPLAPWLTGLPILALLLGDVTNLFLGRDATGKIVSYRERLARLKEIHSMHDYFYLLNAQGSQAVSSVKVPASANPQELQEAIREHFAADSGNIEFRTQTLEEFEIRFYPKDSDGKNQTPENLGVAVQLADPSANGVRVRVLPKGKEDDPEYVKELTVRPEMLEQHASEFLLANRGRGFTMTQLLSHAINRSVVETLEQEVRFPLYAAACIGRQDLVEELLGKGRDVNERAAYGWTPLLMASAQGYQKMVKLMLERGANPDIPNVHGITPLMYAARYGNVPIANSLIDFGASRDLQDVYGDTALTVAVRSGHKAMVRLLLSKGANAEIRNRDGQTPLDLAYKLGQGRIARLLRRAGRL